MRKQITYETEQSRLMHASIKKFRADNPDKEEVQLYKHQLDAFEKFKDSEEIALFFEQGCGKSGALIRIAEELYKNNKITGILIIAPNDVHRQWFDEQIPLFMSVPYAMQCVGGRGGAKDLFEFDDDGRLHVVCVNVDTWSLPYKWKPIAEWALTKEKETLIAIDEATSIKNINSNRTQNLLYTFNNVLRRGKIIVSSEKACRYRAVLTGTPITNGPMDLWSIMEFIRPNFFGRNWWSFRNYYGMFTKMAISNAAGQAREINVLLNEQSWHGIKDCDTYEKAYAIFGCSQDTYFTIQNQQSFQGPYKHADELRDKLNEVAVFCKLVDCVDMPAQNYIIRWLQMSPQIEKCYKQMKAQQIAQYHGHVMTALNKLTVDTRLQQISSGFLYDKDYTVDDIVYMNLSDESEFENSNDLSEDQVQWIGLNNPKLDALERDVDESDKPVIIFTRYSAEASKIYDILSKKYAVCLQTGWKRIGTIEEFKAGKFDVMVANTACIARGFNLQVAHIELFYSNSFSMELRQQAEFRAFRMGQTKNVTYIDYVYKNTVDVRILKALRLKKGMLEYFRGAQSIETLFAEEEVDDGEL